MNLLNIFARSSSYLLTFTLFTAPLSAFSIWFYDQKKRPRTIASIFLFGFLFLGIGIAIMFETNSIMPSEKGMNGLLTGFIVAIILFIGVLRIGYRLTWLSSTLASLIPISYMSYFFFISSLL